MESVTLTKRYDLHDTVQVMAAEELRASRIAKLVSAKDRHEFLAARGWEFVGKEIVADGRVTKWWAPSSGTSKKLKLPIQNYTQTRALLHQMWQDLLDEGIIFKGEKS